MKEQKLYQIGQLAIKANVNIDTIRYYEKRKLIVPKSRTESSFRMYDDESLYTINFIRHAQKLGFQLEEIKDLLNYRSKTPDCCNTVKKKAIAKLDDMELKIQGLITAQKSLKKLIESCDQNDPLQACAIINGLENQPEGLPTID